MNDRSALSIHDVVLWALPLQVATAERGGQLRPNGYCRICGDSEAEVTGTPGAPCPYLACADEYERLTWAYCSCCGELLIAGTPCWSYLTAWFEAVDSDRNAA